MARRIYLCPGERLLHVIFVPQATITMKYIINTHSKTENNYKSWEYNVPQLLLVCILITHAYTHKAYMSHRAFERWMLLCCSHCTNAICTCTPPWTQNANMSNTQMVSRLFILFFFHYFFSLSLSHSVALPFSTSKHVRKQDKHKMFIRKTAAAETKKNIK